MREEPIEEFKVKDLIVRIHQDEGGGGMTPDESGDDSLFLVGYHSDFTVENTKVVSKEGVRSILIGTGVCKKCEGNVDDEGLCWDCGPEEKAELTTHPLLKTYHVFGLEAYIHSGVVLALSREGDFCDRRWDVSQLGAVFVSKKEWKTPKKARAAALSLIEEWNHHLSGEVYGYTISRATKCVSCGKTEEEELDSCWGYVGEVEYCKKEAEAAAKGLAKDKQLKLKL
jgi:hypothetical protein